jgi:hypothetical protein
MLTLVFSVRNSSSFQLAGKLTFNGLPLLALVVQGIRYFSLHPR